MSNYLAIATVTEALIQLLNPVTGVSNTLIDAEPPDMAIPKNTTNRLNIFLYQVTENQGYKNSDLPTRNTDGILVKRPLLGLDLHYMITALGTDDLHAQIVLAYAMQILHETPYLTREFINKAVQLAPTTLGESDLANQVEMIKITHQNMSLEEISKLWSSFFQTNYRLSTTYQVTVVLLESKMETKPTLPVLIPQVTTVQLKQPIIQQVQPQILEYNPSDPTVLTLIGLNFQADDVTVQIGNEKPVPTTSNSDTEIKITIPTSVTPGVKTVQVIQRSDLPIGSSTSSAIVQQVPHNMFKSNVAAFVLAPKITNVNGNNISSTNAIPVVHNPDPKSSVPDLTLIFAPFINPSQQVSFLVGDFELLIPQQTSTNPINSLAINLSSYPQMLQSITNFSGKKYLLRIRVDGAESLLTVDTDKSSPTYGQFIAPVISVT